MSYSASSSYNISLRDWLVSLLLLPLCVYYFFEQNEYTILDSASLMLHHAGHLFFGVFGEAARNTGGMAVQVLVPVGLVVFFWRHHYRLGLQVFLFWLGQSLIHVSTYASDALYGAPAFFREARQDWLYLLGSLDLVHLDAALGTSLYGAGVVCFLVLLFLPGFMEP